MIGSILLKIGMAILGALPLERIAAYAVNRLLARIERGGDVDKAAKTAEHLLELANVFADALADRQMTPEEARRCFDLTASVRLEIIGEWARGRSAKNLEKVLNGADFAPARPPAIAPDVQLLAPDVQLLQTR